MNQELEQDDSQPFARDALLFIASANQVLNVFDFSDPQESQSAAAGDGDLSARIEAAIADRKAAKARKDFAEADRIRDELKAEGIVLKDGSGGETTWERA